MAKSRNICDKCEAPYAFVRGKMRCLCAAKLNKYNAVKTRYGGATYDSKGEAAWAKQLDARVTYGDIRGWERQSKFRLGPVIRYSVDFLVFDNDGTVHAEEFKGKELDKFTAVRALWPIYGLCPLRIVKRDYKNKCWLADEWLTGKDG